MTPTEMREMAREYEQQDEVASVCLNALADLAEEVEALRLRLDAHQHSPFGGAPTSWPGTTGDTKI